MLIIWLELKGFYSGKIPKAFFSGKAGRQLHYKYGFCNLSLYPLERSSFLLMFYLAMQDHDVSGRFTVILLMTNHINIVTLW